MRLRDRVGRLRFTRLLVAVFGVAVLLRFAGAGRFDPVLFFCGAPVFFFTPVRLAAAGLRGLVVDCDFDPDLAADWDEVFVLPVLLLALVRRARPADVPGLPEVEAEERRLGGVLPEPLESDMQK